MGKQPDEGSSRRGFLAGAAAGVGALSAPAAWASRKTSLARVPGGDPLSGWTPVAADEAYAIAHGTIDLDGEWQLSQLPLGASGQEGYALCRKSGGISARVPGDVHLDLMRAGRMPDYRVGDNARTKCRWPEKHSWWYRRTFHLPADFRAFDEQRLVFDGIDLDAEIFLNGKRIGAWSNAFDPAAFLVTSLFREGENELVLRVTSGLEDQGPTTPLAFQQPELALYRNRQILVSERRRLRKPISAAWGMDWCDPLPGIGIWRSVRIEGRGSLAIDALHLDTVLEDDRACLRGEVVLDNRHPWAETAARVEIVLQAPDGKRIARRIDIAAMPGRTHIPCEIEVPNAELWWPNGMGEQPLYRLEARAVVDGRESDRVSQQIGLRTIELDRSPLVEGSRFVIRVNGQPVFCRGGNWIPADLIPASISSERYRSLVADAKEAHFTMLRVWGGGIYESDAFYDACDRAGILIWQEFAFSIASYPDDVEFIARISHEAEALVRRLRHRPSIALWCGNNEIAVGQGYGRCDAQKPVACGEHRIFNDVLAEICHVQDPSRPYRPSSPFGGGKPNTELAGDMHGWDGSGTIQPANEPTNERLDGFRARFVSEYAILGPPHIATIRDYLGSDILDPKSEAWQIHTNFCDIFMGGYIAKGVREHYGEMKLGTAPLETYIFYAQQVQGLLHARALEGLRFRKLDPRDECGGALIWQYNDAWGEIGWSIVDHYLRRKPSYYWFKRAAAPVMVMTRRRQDRLVTRIVNDSETSVSANLRMGWMRFDGAASELNAHKVRSPAFGMIEVGSTPLGAAATRDPAEWCHAAILEGPGLYDQSIWLLGPYRTLRLPEPAFRTRIEGDSLVLESDGFCHAVHLDDQGARTLGDNYVDLLPGVSRKIAIVDPAAMAGRAMRPAPSIV